MKKIISIMLTCLMIVTFSACGGKEEMPVTAEEISTEPVETATVEPVEEREHGAELLEEVTLEFENLYPDFIVGETETTVTYRNLQNNETTVTKNPEKTAVLFNSHLGLWYYLGGTSITKVKGTTNVPEEALGLADMGSYNAVSLEAIVAMEPSLVVLADGVEHHQQLAPSLRVMGIEVMLVEASKDPYLSFKRNAYLFAKINGTEDMYADKISPIIERVDAIIEKTGRADESPKVAAILATSKSLSLESDLTQVGEMVNSLGGNNIYSKEDIKVEGESRVPFSIEALITQNPDIIMVSTMGSIEKATATLEGMISENPAWQEVEAVKNDRVYFLDKELSVYKPNQRYAEAFEMIAEAMYPELFDGE